MTGIKHFTTSTPGIKGRIKKRISDFIVNEITLGEKVYENRAFGDWPEKREQELELTESEKEQLHLTLEKFNMDTTEAVRRLARFLHSSPKRIGYAGMKDKRAITTQRISIWKPDLENLKNAKSRYISLTDPEWQDERIDIGNLKGNKFEITIRNIELKEKELREITEKCFKEMEKGVLNYFGEQRFGGIREITHRVGKEFIKGNFEKGVMLYLTSPSEEEEEIALARKNLKETKDFSKAIKEFPSKFRYERSIIHHLCKFPRDHIGAFQNLPKHLTYMFTHAYQSFLFNQIINERVERKIGFEKITGDVLEDKIPTAGLLGFDSKIPSGIQGEIEKEILEKESLKLEDFKVKSFPELSCKGTRRKMLVIPKNLEVLSIEEDDLFEGALKMRISLSLDKGNYATTILRELMKNRAIEEKALKTL
ncbi:tRNA pseudouridine(13) synthase TruD [archaeon]|nr:tRNA pseudouridine(13) synthase TruD [archaeon]